MQTGTNAHIILKTAAENHIPGHFMVLAINGMNSSDQLVFILVLVLARRI